MLSTIDNPFDPFEQFTSWFLFDVEKGYDSCSLLARILSKNEVSVYSDLSQKEIDDATEQAIDEIIQHDPLNIYIRVEPKQKNIDEIQELAEEIVNEDEKE